MHKASKQIWKQRDNNEIQKLIDQELETAKQNKDSFEYTINKQIDWFCSTYDNEFLSIIEAFKNMIKIINKED